MLDETDELDDMEELDELDATDEVEDELEDVLSSPPPQAASTVRHPASTSPCNAITFGLRLNISPAFD
jgi:hypothetical protein